MSTTNVQQPTQRVHDFFSMYGAAKEVEQELWNIWAAHFNSNEINGTPGFELANRLYLLRDLTLLLKCIEQEFGQKPVLEHGAKC